MYSQKCEKCDIVMVVVIHMYIKKKSDIKKIYEKWYVLKRGLGQVILPHSKCVNISFDYVKSYVKLSTSKW